MNWYSQIANLFKNQEIAVKRIGTNTDFATQKKTNIFLVNGTVEMIGLGAIVTTVKAVGAQLIALNFTPTGGASQVVAVASATTANSPVGTVFTFSGILGSAPIVA